MPRKKKGIEPIVGTGRDPENKLTVLKSRPLCSLWQSDMTLAEFKLLDPYLSRINSHHPEKRTVISTKGELEQLHKCRGEKKALPMLLTMLHEHHYNGKKLRIGHCLNEEASMKLKEMILADYPDADIEIYPLRALCSFYAEKGGILVGFEKE